MVPGGSPWSTSTDCNPRRAAAAAVSRAWLLCGPPAVITVVAPAASACAQVYCSLRTLFPPPPSPLKSSRLTQRLSCANPRAELRRGAASSGVGQLPSRIGARATSADTARHYRLHHSNSFSRCPCRRNASMPGLLVLGDIDRRDRCATGDQPAGGPLLVHE